jgi:hypothetical protein
VPDQPRAAPGVPHCCHPRSIPLRGQTVPTEMPMRWKWSREHIERRIDRYHRLAAAATFPELRQHYIAMAAGIGPFGRRQPPDPATCRPGGLAPPPMKTVRLPLRAGASRTANWRAPWSLGAPPARAGFEAPTAHGVGGIVRATTSPLRAVLPDHAIGLLRQILRLRDAYAQRGLRPLDGVERLLVGVGQWSRPSGAAWTRPGVPTDVRRGGS